MAIVNFIPALKSIEVATGTTISQAAQKAGISLETPCNCVGTCSKCIVRLDRESLKNIASSGTVTVAVDTDEYSWVLSCQAEVMGDVAVELPAEEGLQTLQISNHGDATQVALDPPIVKIYSPEQHETVVLNEGCFLATEPGDTRSSHFGVVVDVGTTTLVASLINLRTGETVASASALNPQSHHAQDVLSRIRYASEESGLAMMHSVLVQEINRLNEQMAFQAAVPIEKIYEIVLCGNTCMLHLAARTSPASLGKYPYAPLIHCNEQLAANWLGFNLAPAGLIYLAPIISGYVGADLTAGVLATGLHNLSGTTLLVDIGTNGEMIIGRDGMLCGTSTAAGPAFEGMNISCGMRASEGAVEYFHVTNQGSIEVKTIGGVKARGICGSGLLDIVGELVEHGVIAANGRFVDPEKVSLSPFLKERLYKRDGKPVFRVADNIFLAQKDIRQVQLAKGAIRAGIEFLLMDIGISARDVDRVLIAGSFGFHLQEKSLINLGLLPEDFAGRVEFVGNTSRSGGEAFLLNRQVRRDMAAVAHQIKIIELANFSDFDKVFVQCLGF